MKDTVHFSDAGSEPNGRLSSELSLTPAGGEFVRLTFDAAPSALLMVDAQGVIQQANEAALGLFGYTREELLGKRVELLIPDRFRQGHDQKREQYHRAPSRRNMGEGRDLFGRRKDGTEIPLEIGLNPVNTSQGLMVISSIVDITERLNQLNEVQLLASQLEKTNAELRKSNSELDNFAYIASHDLKAPLRGIDQLACFIEEDAGELLPEACRQDLDLLRGRIARMENLLDSLLAYSRVGRGQGEKEWVDISALLCEVVELYVPEEYQVQIPAGIPQLYAPRAAVELVFRNLVMNAVKHHNRPQGEIRIEANGDGDWLEFLVSDDGPGVPAEYKDKIFQLFQTLKPRDEVEGSGMGLALVKKTLETVNGSVELCIDDLPGARFRVLWPIEAGKFGRGEEHG